VIGELDERVTFMRRDETKNAYGTLVPVDTEIATVWAKVRPMSGRERDRSQQTEARSNYVVRAHNSPAIREVTAGDFVLWRDAEMNIRFIRDAGPRPLFIEFECERGGPAT
jgi:SPP1 family predicted phage head-tail adaptor